MKSAFGWSVGWHGLLVLGFVLYFFSKNTVATLEKEADPYVAAYVALSPVVSGRKQAKLMVKKIVGRVGILQTPVEGGHPEHSEGSSRGHLQGEQVKRAFAALRMTAAGNVLAKRRQALDRILLQILHDAIAAQLVYPGSALELKQTGTVKIGLQLFPSGQMTRVAILKSSGIASMDAAALTAVQEIPLIEAARVYLSAPEFFSVDVIFQL